MKKGLKEELDKKRQTALEVSIQEGKAASVSSSLGDSYISTFTTALAQNINPKNTGFQIGLLSAISSIVSPIAQIYGSNLMGRFSRKKIVRTFVLLQAMLWIPVGIVALLFYLNILKVSAIYLTIALYALIAIAGGILHPAWFSWIGDLAPETHRGNYFARRNKIIGIFALSTVVISAIVMYYFERYSLTIIGFGIFFILAFVFRLVSYKKFKEQYAPRFKQKESDYFSLISFVRKPDNYGKFAIYQMFFNFAIMLASPFFIVYMKQDLNLSYSMIMIISVSSSFFYLAFMKVSGAISDKYGNLKLMYIANICFVLSPLLWMLFKNPLYLILFPQLIVGLGNAALVLAATNFTYDAVTPQKRGISISYMNILIGIGAFAGSIVGGLLLKYVSPDNLSRFMTLFIIAAIARLLVFLAFIPTLKEVKKVAKFHPMHLKLGHPFKTLHYEVGHFFVKKERKF